jgi:hypothetical protein
VIHLSLRHHKGRDCRGWPSIRRKYGRKRATSGMSTDPLLVLYSLTNPPKPMNWADDVDDEAADAPKIEERDEGNGIKVITEYRTNAEGKKVKVSLRTKNISFSPKSVFQYSPLSSDYSKNSTYPCHHQGQCSGGRAQTVGQIWSGKGQSGRTTLKYNDGC